MQQSQTKQQAHNKQRGFTLIEVLISMSVIAILASITVPTLVSRRVSANESAVIATMRAISQAQFQFQTMGLVDTNSDSGAEFGSLPEMTTHSVVRGTSQVIQPNLLSISLGELDTAGQMQRHGYIFCLYLPDASGKGLPGMPANFASVDAGQAHSYWSCLAWPVVVKSTGVRTFFVNQRGQIMKTNGGPYSGTSNMPLPGAALLGIPADRIDSQQLAIGQPGADGFDWIVVN